MVAGRPDGTPHLAGAIFLQDYSSVFNLGETDGPMSVLWQYYLGIALGCLAKSIIPRQTPAALRAAR